MAHPERLRLQVILSLLYINNKLHGVTSRKVKTLINTDTRNSYPTSFFFGVGWGVGVEGNEYFKIMQPAVMNYKIRNKEITVEHNFIKYSLS